MKPQDAGDKKVVPEYSRRTFSEEEEELKNIRKVQNSVIKTKKVRF